MKTTTLPQATSANVQSTDDVLMNVNNATSRISMTQMIAALSSVSGIKRYVALLAQTGTGAPVATVLENTLGGSIVWTRGAQGAYFGTLSGAFSGNVVYSIPYSEEGAQNSDISIVGISNNFISIITTAGGQQADNILGNITGRGTPITIEVYP